MFGDSKFYEYKRAIYQKMLQTYIVPHPQINSLHMICLSWLISKHCANRCHP